MMKRPGWIILIWSALLLAPGLSVGQDIFVEPDGDFEEKTLAVPYAFYNDAFGAAVGWAHGKIGYPQKQASILGTVMAGTKGSILGFFIGRNLRLPWSERLFLDPIAQIGWFEDGESYSDGNPRFPNERAGIGIQWLQFVPFAEVGRVSPSWNIEKLHEDMKWSAGLGLRFWAKGLVARIDVAGSDEGAKVAMMVSQPFQF